jgi:predicted secreted protein
MNQNTVVSPLARAEGAFECIASMLATSGFGLEILPCLEMRHLGMKREPMSKEEYDVLAYRQLCRQEATRIQEIVDCFRDVGIQVVGLVGIGESPTCSIGNKRGWFMEALAKERFWEDLGRIDIPAFYLKEKMVTESFETLFREWLDNLTYE